MKNKDKMKKLHPEVQAYIRKNARAGGKKTAGLYDMRERGRKGGLRTAARRRGV